MKKCVVALGLFVLLASRASAQTPVTATNGVAFTDVDHTATNADGSPVITRYEVRFVPGAGCAAQPPFDGGKPVAGTGGVITIRPIPTFGTLTANCSYTAVIAAIGSGGEGVGPASDPFARFVPKQPAAGSKPTVVP